MASLMAIFVLWMTFEKVELCRDLTGVESIELAAGGFDCELRTAGAFSCRDGQGRRFRMTVELEPDDCVERAYLVPVEDDLLLVYEYAGGGDGASAAMRVTPAGAVSWRQHVAGFNLSEPLVEGTNVYLTTIDFVGRLDAAEGTWVWRRDDFQERLGHVVSPEALRREGDRLLATSSGAYQRNCELAFSAADGELLAADCE